MNKNLRTQGMTAIGLLAGVLLTGPTLRPQASTEPGKARDGLLLSIRSDKANYTVGEPIQVFPNFKNVTDEPIHFERPTLFYHFIIVRTTGVSATAVQLTDRGRKETDPNQEGAVRGGNLAPGGVIEADLHA